MSTSGFGSDGRTAISGCPSMMRLMLDTFFEFGVVENFVRGRITEIITSDSFGCELRLWALDDDLLLLLVLSVVLKIYNCRYLYSSIVILSLSNANGNIQETSHL